MDAYAFLILLVSLNLLVQLLLAVMASGGTACLRYDYCGGLLALLSAITRNGVVKLIPGNGARNAGLVCLNVYRKIRKRMDIPL